MHEAYHVPYVSTFLQQIISNNCVSKSNIAISIHNASIESTFNIAKVNITNVILSSFSFISIYFSSQRVNNEVKTPSQERVKALLNNPWN